jgi:hypothetical protein
MAVDKGLICTTGPRSGHSGHWQGWKTGSEFKALRDASAAERR